MSSRPICWNCGHFSDEHIGRVGACMVDIIDIAAVVYCCPCSGFVETTFDLVEPWVSDQLRTARDSKMLLVLSWLIHQVQR